MRNFSSAADLPKKIPLLNNPELVRDEGGCFGRLVMTADRLDVPDGYLNNEGIDYVVLKYWPNRIAAPDDFIETPRLVH